MTRRQVKHNPQQQKRQSLLRSPPTSTCPLFAHKREPLTVPASPPGGWRGAEGWAPEGAGERLLGDPVADAPSELYLTLASLSFVTPQILLIQAFLLDLISPLPLHSHSHRGAAT